MDKTALLAQFETYLSSLDTWPDEDPATVDLFSLFTELAALKNEVKLESRQIKSALDNFRQVFSTLEASHQLTADAVSQQAARQVDDQRSHLKPLLLALIQFKDALDRSANSVMQYKNTGYPWRRSQRARQLASLHAGHQLLRDHFDALLKQQGVLPIMTIGHPLDPQVARAVDVQCDNAVPHGVVLAEIRTGYCWQGDVLRLAEVVVNKQELSNE